ncbi:MAG: hypothetical protein V3T72_14495 [Thermoanaerobaculia bacterium]
MKRFIPLLTIVLLAAASQALAADKTYTFGVSEQRTNITFQSDTDFEVILGSTRRRLLKQE